MNSTTLSFDNMHTHGDLFTTLLRTRKHSLFIENDWDMPVADGMEYDQYDSPASRWIAVHKDGKVLAGIRLIPTTAKCGIYSYMIRDAQNGLLEYLPKDLLDFDAPTAPHIWEASRMFISGSVPENERMNVLSNLMEELISAARTIGATQVIGLVPTAWSRRLPNLGIDCAPAGPKMMLGDNEIQVTLIMLTANLH